MYIYDGSGNEYSILHTTVEFQFSNIFREDDFSGRVRILLLKYWSEKCKRRVEGKEVEKKNIQKINDWDLMASNY